MVRRFRFITGVLALLGLFAANIYVARAHTFAGVFHWHKGGTQIVIQQYQTGSTVGLIEAARQDGWNKISLLYNYAVNYHTDVSVYDGNYGNTGWAGLATFESYSGNHILHGHATLNLYYSASNLWRQGVYCQEVFHTYGFDHSNTGDCMGLTYYSNTNYYLGPHNNTDFYNLYRYH